MRETGDDATPNFENIGATDSESMTAGGATQFDPTEFEQTTNVQNVTPFANGANGGNGGNGDKKKDDAVKKAEEALGTEILNTELHLK